MIAKILTKDLTAFAIAFPFARKLFSQFPFLLRNADKIIAVYVTMCLFV